MSGGKACCCEEPFKERMKNWVIRHYKHNHSYFNAGPRGAEYPSDYSTIFCKKCHQLWRTKAKYVEKLTIEEWEWGF